MNNRSIIINEKVLSDEFIPSYIHEREHHIKSLMSAMIPAVRGRKPINIWIYGKPGTGKTCISRFTLRKLEERWNTVQGIYVNCWKNNTLYSILDHIVKEYRLLGGEAPSTAVKLERFLNFVKTKPFIVILDEIDIPSPRERNNILYNLSRTGNVGIICVSRTDDTYHHLDERVKSRLSSRMIEFEDYSTEQVFSILQDRAKRGLRPNSYDDEILKVSAELAQGDIRIALETLKSAAESAEPEANKIALLHVHQGAGELKGTQKQQILKKLTQHHQIIYNIINEKAGLLSGDLWSNYIDVCRKINLQPIARRTFSQYLQKLERERLIKSDKPAIRGKVRSFKILELS